jgi:hypothetical protein
MIVTAWNNGQHNNSGAGYGVKLSALDRDRIFDTSWRHIFLKLEGELREIEVNIAKNSFWGDTCRELIKKEIGQWMIANNLAPWPRGKPPKLELEPVKDNHFILKKRAT